MARCCHLVGGHPATLGDGDAVTDDVVEMRDGVGIGVVANDAMLAGAAHEFVAQVQPVREVADFPGGIGAGGGCEHGIDVEIAGGR